MMNNPLSIMDFPSVPQQIVPQAPPVAPHIPQLSLQTPSTPNPSAVGTAANPQQKEFNLLTLCRIGQETVQDILSRFQEVFGILKVYQPPNGLPDSTNASAERRLKVQEQFRTIRLLFKRLRLLYDKCGNADQDYTQIESLIPLVEDENKPDTVPVTTEEYQRSLMENRELTEILVNKNMQLKEIIDRIRSIIWEINTMMSNRKS